MICLIGLGSNLGDREKNCERAVFLLRQQGTIQVTNTSKWYETKAVCLPGEMQPDFINGVVEVKTTLPPESLHQELKKIEREMGRESSPKKWQPRIIDLDLLFYGDQILETPALKIPHPLAHERLFVLEPLNEIAPDFVHPILKKSVARLYQDMLKTAQ